MNILRHLKYKIQDAITYAFFIMPCLNWTLNTIWGQFNTNINSKAILLLQILDLNTEYLIKNKTNSLIISVLVLFLKNLVRDF